MAQITREGDVGKVKRLLDLLGSGQGSRAIINKLDESKVIFQINSADDQIYRKFCLILGKVNGL